MYTIVVADDEEELRRALIRRVDWESAGFSVVGEAENGVEALELVEKYEPDLLLTDIRMPFLSGIELARQVREMRPATQIAFLSGFDDFSYAQQAIQYNIVSYMLKPISASELTEELIKIRKRIDEKFQRFASPTDVADGEAVSFLMPLLLDGYTGVTDVEWEERLMSESVACGLLPNAESDISYAVMVTSIIDAEQKNQTSRATVRAVEQILEKYVKHASFYMPGRVVTFLQASPTRLDKYLHIIVEEIAQSVRRIMNCEAQIGVSRVGERLSNAHEAYVEAMNVIRYAKRNAVTTHFIADVERSEDLDIKRIQAAVDELEKYMRGGNREELHAYLSDVFVQMEQEHMSSAVMGFMLAQMVNAVIRIVYAVAEESVAEEFRKNVPLFMNEEKEGKEVMQERYINFCLSARDLISEQRKKSSNQLCDKAREIIEKNYMNQDLSLSYVSNEIAISPNYLSALIKKATGSTFVDLLSQKRIEVAKELLMCTDMKIREIAEKCGYSDQHYFSYCFKKYTGMSPNACRGK